jgi:error-prone DNA polymerase
MFPLAVHSHYSLRRGVCSPAAICRAARLLGYQGLALTDLDNLYGLWPFLAACRQEGISPLVGATVTASGAGPRAVCLVKDREGYRNLCLLLTARHTDPAFDLGPAVAAHGAGLVVLATDSELLSLWAGRQLDVAAALADRPTAANHHLYRQARRLGVPAVAVPASFFLIPEEYELHRLLRAIACRTSMSRLTAEECVSPAAWLASPAEYRRRFAMWPEVVINSQAIADRCSFRGPEFGVVLPPYASPDGRGAAAVLREEAGSGAGRRYGEPLPARVIARLEHELRIIIDKGFAPYFLVVQEIVRRYPRICGRGSGAASLVAYVLGITNVCPVKHDLYFERFLNPGRSDPPDIDIDFAWDERDEVLQAVLARYGRQAAMVCSHIPFQPRMAIRETARAFGLTEGEISRLTKRLPWLRRILSGEDPVEHLAGLPQLKDADLTGPWPEIIRLAAQLVGIPRHLSVHPGGVVITPDPIAGYVPVERAAKGVPIIQWDKDGAEEAGLVKIDLLGNRSLGVIRDALVNLRRNGEPFGEAGWQPEDDAATQATVAAGLTMGCFYIESPAIRQLQQKAGRGDFAHLVIHSSIIRPAANEFIREYLRRLHGGAWQPLHPLLGEVLHETFGIMVYQEDVSRTAVALAGFSHAEADALRKVLSKKDRARRLQDYRQQFFAGAGERGIGPEQAETLWRMMMSFDGYSFCKPHSASYARVSFQAAYLKTHFPAEFMAAVISNQGGYYSTFAYVSEARRLGLSILPPDVSCSGIRWQGRGRALRAGLMAVKNLGRETQERVMAERRERNFRSTADFLSRVRPDEEEVRNMIHAGALDSLPPGRDRAGLLWEAACWRKRQQKQGAGLIFAPEIPEPPSLPPTPARERYRREFQIMGFLCDCHPITFYTTELAAHKTVKAADLGRFINRQVMFAGWLLTGKTVSTRTGEAMEFLTFEDETGLVEATFFPRVYRQCCHLLEVNRPFLLSGRAEEDFGAVTLTVTGCERLQRRG